MDGGVRVIHGGAQRIKSDKLVGYRNQRVFGEADVWKAQQATVLIVAVLYITDHFDKNPGQ